jgi:hypothetical protein
MLSQAFSLLDKDEVSKKDLPNWCKVEGSLHILLNPQGLGIRSWTEACARNGEIPKFAKYAQILKNSVASK